LWGYCLVFLLVPTVAAVLSEVEPACAVGVLADQLAFGLGALGLLAHPVALCLLADVLAFGLWHIADRLTSWSVVAYWLALGALLVHAVFLRAPHLEINRPSNPYLTLWLLALQVTLNVGYGLTLAVAVRRLTDGGADCIALRVVALPRALRVALG